jgi:tetratricopeptide (TPR) repeat protein
MIHRHSYFKIDKFTILISLSIFVLSCGSVRSVQVKRAKQHYEKGQYLVSKGEVDKAILNFEKSIKIARAAGFKEGVAHNLNELAIINTAGGEYDKAREQFSEAHEIYKDLDMAPEASKTLNNMAITYTKERKFQEALSCYGDLIAWDTKTGNQLGVGITLYNMAIIYHQHMGMNEKAEECLNKALKIFKETGNERYIEMIQEKIKKD